MPFDRRRFFHTALSAALMVGLRQKSGQASQSGFTVVVLGSFSGARAVLGIDALDGINLALKEAGFRLANLEVRVEIADDKGEPGLALQLAKQKVGLEPVDVVMTALSPSSLTQVLPIFANAGILVLNLAPAPQSLADQNCSPWLFDLVGEEDSLHEAAAQMLIQDGIKRLVVLGPDRPSTDHAVEVLGRSFQGSVVATVKTGEGTATFAKELGMIRHVAAEAIYSVLTGGMSVAFAHAWGEQEPLGRPKLYAPWFGFERTYLAAMGEAALGINTVGSWAADMEGPINHRLVTEFESEYGRIPTSPAAYGFDAVVLLENALKQGQGKTMDKEAIRMALRRTELASVRGTLRFNSNQFPIQSYWRRVVTKDSHGRLVNETKSVLLRDWKGHNGLCALKADAPLPPAPVKKKGP